MKKPKISKAQARAEWFKIVDAAFALDAQAARPPKRPPAKGAKK